MLSPDARPRPFCIWLGKPAIRWSGFWYIEGKELCIGSAYGDARRKLGRRKPELLAEELLIEVLRAKLAAKMGANG